MKKQTAVEWLIEELGEYFPHEIGGIHLMVDRAKQMEKEQIIDALCDGRLSVINKNIISSEQYFNETFKQ